MIPVFILSSERSGSNLLRKILGSHSKISAPPPVNLFNTLSESLVYSGPLTNPDNIKALINDAVSRAKLKGTHLSWNIDIDPDKIYSKINTGLMPEIIYYFYKSYSDIEGSQFCVIKENNSYKYVDSIKNYMTNAKFVFLVRDARDVICSNKRIKARRRHIYTMANQWIFEQMNHLKIYNEISSNNNIILVKYEELLENPYNVINKICDLLNIDFEKEMLNFHKEKNSKIEANQSEFWKNLNQPLMKNNKGKFQSELSNREIRLIEIITSDVMEILGYPLITRKNLKIGFFRSLKYKFLDNIYQIIYNRNRYLDKSIQNLRKGRKEIRKRRKKHKKVLFKN